MGHQMDERHDYAMFLLNEVHIPLDRPLNIEELVIPAENNRPLIPAEKNILLTYTFPFTSVYTILYPASPFGEVMQTTFDAEMDVSAWTLLYSAITVYQIPLSLEDLTAIERANPEALYEASESFMPLYADIRERILMGEEVPRRELFPSLRLGQVILRQRNVFEITVEY